MYNIRYKIFYFSVLFFLLITISCQKENNEENNKPSLSSANTPPNSASKKIQDLNNKGSDERDNANYTEALNLHFEAFRLAEENKDTLGQIFALNNIGTDLRRTSSNSEASTYHYAALELAGNNPKLLKSRAVAMNGLGNIFLSLNKLKRARSYFSQSLEIEKHLKSNLGQAINYANIAETFQMNKDYDSALYYFNQSLYQNKIINSTLGIAIYKKSVGKIYLNQGKSREALKLMNEAVEQIDNSNDVFHKLEMKMTLCETLIKLDYLNEAKPILNEILTLSKQINSFDHISSAYNLLTQLRQKENDFKGALEAKNQVFIYRDSVLKQNNEVRILELENRFKSKQAAQQIQLLTKEKFLSEKNKKNQQVLFALLTIFFVGFSGLLYYRYRNKRQVTQELEKINEMKSRFFANISHEFRTPLTLIKAPVENMMENVECEKMSDGLNTVLRNTNQILFLVEQLLNISKLDAGKFTVHVQEGNLSSVISAIANSFQFLAQKKSIEYNVNIKASEEVWFDVNIVEIILVNLLSNAIKFTPENGKISLSTQMKNGIYDVSIINSIEKKLTEKELEQIFDRFYTTANHSHSGTGIGLSLIKEICTLYRASLDVKSHDKQIEFKVSLPVEKSHFSSDEISSQKTVEPFYFDTLQENKKTACDEVFSEYKETPLVLIVEDNEDMSHFLHQIFHSDYQVILAKDGAEGIQKAQEMIPDIIISDVMMPNVSGLSLCKTLKGSYLTNHIPIILLTALNERENEIEGLECRAADYVAKPFNSRVLLTKVRNLLENRDLLIKKTREELPLQTSKQIVQTSENDFMQILSNVSASITQSDFDVDEFCKVSSMSRTQLHRKLKAVTGLSATAYIRYCRVKIASEMLRDSKLTVSEVCYASGFNDASYFSKCFKEEFNISPADFRKNIS